MGINPCLSLRVAKNTLYLSMTLDLQGRLLSSEFCTWRPCAAFSYFFLGFSRPCTHFQEVPWRPKRSPTPSFSKNCVLVQNYLESCQNIWELVIGNFKNAKLFSHVVIHTHVHTHRDKHTNLINTHTHTHICQHTHVQL